MVLMLTSLLQRLKPHEYVLYFRWVSLKGDGGGVCIFRRHRNHFVGLIEGKTSLNKEERQI